MLLCAAPPTSRSRFLEALPCPRASTPQLHSTIAAMPACLHEGGRASPRALPLPLAPCCHSVHRSPATLHPVAPHRMRRHAHHLHEGGRPIPGSPAGTSPPRRAARPPLGRRRIRRRRLARACTRQRCGRRWRGPGPGPARHHHQQLSCRWRARRRRRAAACGPVTRAHGVDPRDGHGAEHAQST